MEFFVDLYWPCVRTLAIGTGKTALLWPSAGPYAIEELIAHAPSGVNDGKGFVLISHTGEVYPSGFLPLSAGNIRRESLADIYRNCPLFLSLRDVSQLTGKC